MDFASAIPLRSLQTDEPKELERDDDQKEVEDEESEHDESISPPILVPDIQRDEEVLSNSSGPAGKRRLSLTLSRCPLNADTNSFAQAPTSDPLVD